MFLFGPFSNLYALADRLPAKPWADTFGWYYEVPEFQQKLLASWDSNGSDVILWQNPPSGNWFDPGTYQPKMIVNWILANYQKKEEGGVGLWLWQKK